MLSLAVLIPLVSVLVAVLAAYAVYAAAGKRRGTDPDRLRTVGLRAVTTSYCALGICAAWAYTPISNHLPRTANLWITVLLLATVPGAFAFRLAIGFMDATIQRAVHSRRKAEQSPRSS